MPEIYLCWFRSRLDFNLIYCNYYLEHGERPDEFVPVRGPDAE